MAVILSGLKQLRNSMVRQGLLRQKFDYKVGDVLFDVCFFIDEGFPFDLLFGARGHNVAFQFQVHDGYVVQDVGIRPEEVFFKLRQLLGITGGPGTPFSGQTFLRDFKSHIPDTAFPAKVPEPHETASVRRDVSDDARIYFYGWRNNDAYGSEVREVNLLKTRRLLGRDIELFCIEKNLSTKWTDIPADKVKFSKP